MLYRPVYLKGRQGKPMHSEALISVVRPPPSPPPQPPPPPETVVVPEPPAPPVEEAVDEVEELEDTEESGENLHRLPLLIARHRIVVPPEATRDVLSGRVPYVLVENDGMTLFKPAHLFSALKLGKQKIGMLEDYPCLGAHERVLDRRTPRKRTGLGYRRKYISPELIGQGIFVRSA